MQHNFSKISLTLLRSNQVNVVLVMCGSFNPITHLHLWLFENARNQLRGCNVVGGLISPVNGNYSHKKLLDPEHRIKMCELAVAESDWLAVDSWEAKQAQYVRTLLVLEELQVSLESHFSKKFSVRLLCGADLFDSFTKPGVWREEDFPSLFGDHGVVVTQREGSPVDTSLTSHPLLPYKESILFVSNDIRNTISSTIIRNLVANGCSVRYLTPPAVADYISCHQLYLQ
eukprot:GCRY01005880.1.p1 GENE.GCRY01005880.1~~GCRY01005880.1.p1  ORF type:complete len:229 (-),score=19.25 GCRY01005880.1:178-864(-)